MKQRKILGSLVLVTAVTISLIIVLITTNKDSSSKGYPAVLSISTLEPLSAGIYRMESVPLVHQNESDYIDIPDDIKVYPAPNANISIGDYQRGSVFGSLLSSTPYNVCVYAQIITNKFCVPRQFITPPPSIDWECPLLGKNWTSTDFRPYVQIYLDREAISGEQADSEHSLEEYDPMIHNAFYFCYRVPLDPGAHTMRYEFTLPEENIYDTAEWSFTITP